MASAFPAFSADRAWTVADSIGTRYFSQDLEYPAWGDRKEVAVTVSPDGRHFALVTHRGDLACDCHRYELHFFAVRQVREAMRKPGALPLEPLHVVRMSSTQRALSSAIRQVSWEDEHTLLFRGTGQAGDKVRLFRFDIRSGALSRLTDGDHEVSSYDIHGKSVLYHAWKYQPRGRDPLTGLPAGFSDYPMQAIRGGGPFGRGLSPYVRQNGYEIRSQGLFLSRDGTTREISPFQPNPLFRPGDAVFPRISPDGRWAVVMLPPGAGETVPSAWTSYVGLEAPYPLIPNESLGRLQRPALLNMETGVLTPLWNAPLGPLPLARQNLWSQDSRHIVLVNVSLPLQGDLSPEELDTRRRSGYIVDYDVSTGAWSALQPVQASEKRVSSVEWLHEGRELLVQQTTADKKPIEGMVYTLKAGKWVGKPVAASVAPPVARVPVLEGGIRVSVRESANQPPIAVASDGKHEVTLIGEDAALAGVWRAPQEDVQWTEPADVVAHAGLLLPREGIGSKPYPLVVQINDYAPERFWPDGERGTAYAAQPLVAQGIAVLQMSSAMPPAAYARTKGPDGRPFTRETARWLAGPLFVERLDAAVSMLASRGLVDPKRVGLIGFSFKGYIAYYALTHPQKITPAAALVADASLRGYGDCMLESGASSESAGASLYTSLCQRFYGGYIWDEGAKQRWLEHSPPLNVFRAETPTLFVYNGSVVPEAFLETIAVFRVNRREIDMLLIPGAEHELHRPLQRQASLQASVDWMTFWLNGKEDAAPEKKEQYWYWRGLRAQRDARQKSQNLSAR